MSSLHVHLHDDGVDTAGVRRPLRLEEGGPLEADGKFALDAHTVAADVDHLREFTKGEPSPRFGAYADAITIHLHSVRVATEEAGAGGQ